MSFSAFRTNPPCLSRSRHSNRLTTTQCRPLLTLNKGFLKAATQHRSFSQVAHSKSNDEPATSPSQPDVMVIGSMTVDLTCTVPTASRSSMHFYTSHLANIRSSAGGVAHNVALATSYASSSSVRLVTAVGSDPEGQWLREYVKTTGLDVDFIPAEGETARYIAVQDGQGEAIVTFADMSIIAGISDEDLRMRIQNSNPKFVAFDGYLSPTAVKTVLEQCGSRARGIISESLPYH